MRILRAGAVYFALVFGAGFVLGTARTLWVTPRVGARTAELVEAPVMLAITILAARRLVKGFSPPPVPVASLGMGFSALVLMLVAEFTLVLGLRGLPIRQYLTSRDPVAGAVYYFLLAVFALMPFLMARKQPR
ncbi:MAG TPA: hypothetical protein VJN43_14580 [Bryobacteraceae bacterium]|nr:hypothetical protein [Bryobacteraceae bacterium]